MGAKETASVKLGGEVLLFLVRALLISLFLLASGELQENLQQVCRPAMLIGCLNSKDK